MRIVIGAGGTGGHIIPAIALSEEMAKRGWKVSFIGNRKSLEETLVRNAGFPFFPITVQKLYRKATKEHLKFPFLFTYSTYKCWEYLSNIKPDTVFCTGGFVSGPTIFAAILLKIPIYLQDANSYPGLTIRKFAKRAKRIFIAFEQAVVYLPAEKCLISGNPIIPYEKIKPENINWDELNLNPEKRKLLIIGGSQGSRVINKIITECAREILARNIELIWQTGKSEYPALMKKFSNVRGMYLFDFTTRMSTFYQIAHLAISRAGALALAELEEFKVPAILIPLPEAAANHQMINARAQKEKSIALILDQRLLTRELLLHHIDKLLTDYKTYKEALNKLKPNNAVSIIADSIEQDFTAKET